MYHVTPLKNGLTVATAEMPHMASVSLGIWVGVGGRYESAKLNGICHFIEHLLFKGTKKRSARKISEAVEGVGGELNAFTSEESTCYYSKARHDRFEELLEVLGDMFLNSTFDPVEIQKERDVIKEEIAMYLDQPQMHVQELLSQTLWPDHPLGRPLTGTEQTLDVIQRPELLRYFRDNYVTGNTLVAVAGNIRHEQVVRCVSRLAPKFVRGQPPRFLTADGWKNGTHVRLETKKTEQTQLALGIRTCSRHDSRRHALTLLNAMLGENMSSRLFQVVREDHGLAYSISSSLSFYADVGALTVSAGLETDNLQKALRLVMKELHRFTLRPPTAAELRRARDYVIGQFQMHLESTSHQMNRLGDQWLGYGRINPPQAFEKHLMEVKPTQIRAAARDFFRSERLVLALVSPLKTDRGLAPLLKI